MAGVATILIRPVRAEVGPRGFHTAYQVQREQQPCSTHQPISFSQPSYTGHPAVLQTACKWLTKCLQNHNACHSHDEEGTEVPGTWRPKRLLELNGEHLRLIICQEHENVGPYAALSHCWGKDRSFLTLTTANNGDLIHRHH
jgi:hypothetical protein